MTVISPPFARAVACVLRHEGGLSDDAADPGGVTNFGISIRFAGSVKLDLNGDGATTRADILAMDRATAERLYRRHFWEPLRAGELPGGLGYAVFDAAVNQGVGAAARLLQRSLRMREDGTIGPATLAAAARRGNDLAGLVAEFMAQRNTRYARLAIERAPARGFLLGWYRRTAEVHATAATW
jgi:lysozyme family protein